MGKHTARLWDIRNLYKILIRKRERRKQLGRPKNRWKSNTKMDVQEVRLDCAERIHPIRHTDQWTW